MPTRKKVTVKPAVVVDAEEPVALSTSQTTAYTAEQLLNMLPAPIQEPTQREYGEIFYPKYKRAYDTIKQSK